MSKVNHLVQQHLADLARPGVDGDGAVLGGPVDEQAPVPVPFRAGHDRREDDPYGGAHGRESDCFSEWDSVTGQLRARNRCRTGWAVSQARLTRDGLA